MKYSNLAALILLFSPIAARADDAVNLCHYGDMEEIAEDSSSEAPKGWFSIGDGLHLESDTTEFQAGARSLKVNTPEQPTALSSDYIVVHPNTAYLVQVSVLARGESAMSRPFTGLKIAGNDEFEVPEAKGEYLLSWNPSDEDIGFVTKKARFVTGPNIHKIRIVMLIRSKPRGIVNVDDIILRETDQTE